MRVYYVPGSTNLEATINDKTGLLSYSNKTTESFEKANPKAIQMDFEEANEQINIAIQKTYVTLPKLISAEFFDEALDVLPPLNWITTHNGTTFMMSEFDISYITAIYAKIGNKCYFFSDSYTLTHEEIIEKCNMSKTVFSVKNDFGIVFNIKIVRDGEKQHSVNGELVHSGKPIVEFYDKRFEHTPLGQYVSSYYVSTILEIGENEGLCLDTGSRNWCLSDFEMNQVKYHLLNIS